MNNIETQISEMWDALAESREFCTEAEYDAAYQDCKRIESKIRREHAVNSFAIALASMSTKDQVESIKSLFDTLESKGYSSLHTLFEELARTKVEGGEW